MSAESYAKLASIRSSARSSTANSSEDLSMSANASRWTSSFDYSGMPLRHDSLDFPPQAEEGEDGEDSGSSESLPEDAMQLQPVEPLSILPKRPSTLVNVTIHESMHPSASSHKFRMPRTLCNTLHETLSQSVYFLPEHIRNTPALTNPHQVAITVGAGTMCFFPPVWPSALLTNIEIWLYQDLLVLNISILPMRPLPANAGVGFRPQVFRHREIILSMLRERVFPEAVRMVRGTCALDKEVELCVDAWWVLRDPRPREKKLDELTDLIAESVDVLDVKCRVWIKENNTNRTEKRGKTVEEVKRKAAETERKLEKVERRNGARDGMLGQKMKDIWGGIGKVTDLDKKARKGK